jgi:hypothetical protein
MAYQLNEFESLCRLGLGNDRADGLMHDMTLCQAVCDVRFWLLVRQAAPHQITPNQIRSDQTRYI